MNAADTRRAIVSLGGRLAELETFAGDQFQRLPVGGIGGEFEPAIVNVLPAIPPSRKIIFLESVDAAQLPDVVPKPDAKDMYWWASPNDTRWHPIAGKLADIAGNPGDMSEA